MRIKTDKQRPKATHNEWNTINYLLNTCRSIATVARRYALVKILIIIIMYRVGSKSSNPVWLVKSITEKTILQKRHGGGRCSKDGAASAEWLTTH